MVEHTYYARVKASHVIQGAWMNQTAKDNAAVAWMEHTNLFSRWIATRILKQPSKSLRGKMISKFITLAEVCCILLPGYMQGFSVGLKKTRKKTCATNASSGEADCARIY
jgi:hypothetical protein